MAETEAVVTKGAFAKIAGVTPGRVSQWLKAGQIGRAALKGVGRNAKIRVALAQEHLKRNLDTDQRLGLNGITTNLGDADKPAPSDEPRPMTTEARIAAEKLAGLERKNRLEHDEELARQGFYTLTSTVQAGYARIAGQMVGTFEGALPDLASALAAKFSLQQREVLHLLRREFRQVRSRAAEQARRSAAVQPALAPTEIEDDADDELDDDTAPAPALNGHVVRQPDTPAPASDAAAAA